MVKKEIAARNDERRRRVGGGAHVTYNNVVQKEKPKQTFPKQKANSFVTHEKNTPNPNISPFFLITITQQKPTKTLAVRDHRAPANGDGDGESRD